MSQIAPETAPLSSKPYGGRGEFGEEPGEEAATTPRTRPNEPGMPEAFDEEAYENESQDAEYIHKASEAKKGTEEAPHIETMKETDVHPAEEEEAPEVAEGKEREKEVGDESVGEKPKTTGASGKEQDVEGPETAGPEARPEEEDTEANLTKEAKEPSEKAPEKQASHPMRDSFFKSAGKKMMAPFTGAQTTGSTTSQAGETETAAGETEKELEIIPPVPEDEDQEELEIAPSEGPTEETEVSGWKTKGEDLPEALETEQGSEAEDEEEKRKQKDDQKPMTEDVTEGREEKEAAASGKEEEEEENEKAAAPPAEEQPDLMILKDGTVNKLGNVVSAADSRTVVGRIASIEGAAALTPANLRQLAGCKVDERGSVWRRDPRDPRAAPVLVGKAEAIPDAERDELLREQAPFENFPDAVVDVRDGEGVVVAGEESEVIGKVVDAGKEGDVKKLKGSKVDADGDILDKAGNVIGKAERWEKEPEPEEPEPDRSILAGKRVNKAGNVVDSSGTVYGRVVDGEDGTVVTPSGDVVGRLVSGDPKTLFGRPVDEDGDVLDRNGNPIGKAERWEPEVAEKEKNPMAGRKVNREGGVVDEHGNLIGKLTSGELSVCIGKEIDDDGDVINSKGTTIGHCSLLEDIPAEPEPEGESPEEKEKREQLESDKKLAIQMAACIEQCLESIRPICKMITEANERDEEALVRDVKPLIEEGGRILSEARGVIKGLDPDGRIAANAKHKTAAREATPEEYHLADVLKDLTGDVTQCIDNARRKLEDMPHAKKELNPLWGLLNEPLFQILAAVGLLLAGVLNLVGRLLGGLGLGGIVDGLLGTLGLNRVLEGLGLGSFSKSLKGGKKGGGGGLLGGILGG
ncbi:hypothetical protein VTJ83DRAFT_5109 [Remersonia thermophila]|uniref:DUF6987 domain-containing protein n=1 Tax=Remersonia thermophila TaxID=72144 RepID=A0ABR4DBU9_9PEZI